MVNQIEKKVVSYFGIMLCYGILLIVLFSSCQKQVSDLRVSFLDVGKGDCILVQTREKVMMIDTGYKDTVKIMDGYLRKNKISRIDALILTHYDKDHIGGASFLLKNYEVGTVYLPGYKSNNEDYNGIEEVIRERNIQNVIVSEDTVVEGIGTNCTIYASNLIYEEKKQNDNNVSLVTSLIYKEDSFLFAGDIEKKGIKTFLEKQEDKESTYDIVKMPHHGREKSNLSEFISKLQPMIAVITDSKEEPSDESTIELLEKQEVQVYRSSQGGTIVIDSNGVGTYTVEK